MNRARLRARIERHEGYRERPYQDHLGNWTIGVGHLIEHVELRALTPHRTLGSLLTWLCSRETHDRWLEQDIAEAETDARRWLGDDTFEGLSDIRQEVATELAFQLGLPRLSTFVRLREAIQAGQWIRAEAELLDSKYADQVPERAKALASLLLEG